MAIKVELLPDESIVIVYFQNPFDVPTDIPAVSQHLNAILDASDLPIWNITVASDLQISFGQMVEGLALMTKGDFSAMNHPKIAGRSVVANQSLVRLGAEALGQAQYGGYKMSIAETLEQALEKVRTEINKQAKAA